MKQILREVRRSQPDKVLISHSKLAKPVAIWPQIMVRLLSMYGEVDLPNALLTLELRVIWWASKPGIDWKLMESSTNHALQLRCCLPMVLLNHCRLWKRGCQGWRAHSAWTRDCGDTQFIACPSPSGEQCHVWAFWGWYSTEVLRFVYRDWSSQRLWA